MDPKIGSQYHKCNESLKQHVEIVYTDFDEETGEKQWWFHIFQEATEKDLEDGKADEIGKLLFSSAIAISFCPFCGTKLIAQSV